MVSAAANADGLAALCAAHRRGAGAARSSLSVTFANVFAVPYRFLSQGALLALRIVKTRKALSNE